MGSNDLESLVTRIGGNKISRRELSAIQSNLQYHKYGSTDSHDVSKRYYGLVEKFSIHHDIVHKATSLSECLGRLHRIITSKKRVEANATVGKSSLVSDDAVFDVLRLMLDLSVDATRSAYEPSALLVQKPVADCGVSWESILRTDPLKGEHWDLSSIARNDSDSDLDTLDQEEDNGNRFNDYETSKGEQNASIAADTQSVMDWLSMRLQKDSSLVCDKEDALNVVQQLIDRQYWKSNYKPLVRPKETLFDIKDPNTLRLAVATRESLMMETFFRPVESLFMVSEVDLVRESLFAFAGRQSQLISVSSDGSVCWTSGVSVAHLTDTALDNVLGSIFELASTVNRLRVFSTKAMNSINNQTLCAFAYEVHCLLKDWSEFIVDLEFKLLNNADTTVSLLAVLTEAKRNSLPFGVIADFLDSFKHFDWKTLAKHSSDFELSIGLIEALLNAISRPSNDVATLARLIVASIQPLLQFLDNALVGRQFHDVFDEMPFVCRPSSNKTSSQFWTSCCQSRESVKKYPFIAPFIDDIVHTIKVSILWNTSRSELTICKPLADAVNDHLKCNWNSSTQSVESFSHIFKSALKTTLLPYFTSSLDRFKKLVFEEGKVAETMQLLHDIHFLLRSDIMSPFTHNLFQKLESGSFYHEGPLALQSIFCDAVLGQGLEHQIQLDAFNFHWENQEAVFNAATPSKVFDNICIEFVPPWPFNLVLCATGQRTYSRITRFILYMNYARHCLNRVRDWKTSEDKSIQTQIHHRTAKKCMIQLRMLLMHFMTSVQTYVMHGVVHSESAALIGKLESAVSFDEVFAEHERTLKTISERLFLSEKGLVFREEIKVIFDMCVELGSAESACNTMNEASSLQATLEKMRLELRESVRFLVDGLTVLSSHGGLPMLTFANSLHQGFQ